MGISGLNKKVKINRSTVEALPYFKPNPEKPNTNQQLVFDSVLPGFGVRITENNKAYFVYSTYFCDLAYSHQLA